LATRADQTDAASIEALLSVMARLRAKDGCPWDQAQTFSTIAPYTIEEAYEVADAIQRENLADLKEELGDLLLQVVFHSRIAEELGAFDFADVVRAIVGKMVRRHPHVFGEAQVRTAEEQTAAWEEIKARERSAKAASAGLLDDVAVTLPALTRAVKLSSRAARVGFVWEHVADIVAKLHEEVAELEIELAAGDKAKAQAELGDVLFVCANIAREMEIDPEEALREANAKFVRRFSFIEKTLAVEGRSPEVATLGEMEAIWQAAKRAER
jgi:nucleoside triphosphate diphosphatase